jgi:hypothetical protein
MILALPNYGRRHGANTLTYHHLVEANESICMQRTYWLQWLIMSQFLLLLLITNAADGDTHVNEYKKTPLEIQYHSPRTVGFTHLNSTDTGIHFTNQLEGDAFLTDAVAHNGSGIAIGDINNDGWVDAYFCNLQGPNLLYFNKGNWKFSEMEPGPASCENQRSTAAALVDLDGDKDLDLLVNGIAAGTRLFLNDGNGIFQESKQSGLSQTSSPSSMALADIDGDGDLDLYCANYIDEMHIADPTTDYKLSNRNGQYVVTHVNGEPTTTPRLRNRFVVSKTGRLRELPEADGLYLNDGQGQFKAIHFNKGTFNSADGRPVQPPRDWSLAVMLRDLNQDGSPDIYVCTDNATPDRIWINNGDGTFNAMDRTNIRHTSRSSMGIDAADINRDGIDDFYVVDMFARDHEKRMTQLAKQHSSPDTIQHIMGLPRYNRNTLFKGREDGSFSEIALMAGVAASDWSWCPVFLDVDLDGYEDLLVTNGFSFDVMDQDSQDQLRTMKLSKFDRKRSRQFHPSFMTKNASFRNTGNGHFEPADDKWGFDISGISYGMALGDLDNDGDLDAMINQLNEPAIVLRNDATAPRIKVTLEGPANNTHGIGTRIRLFNETLIQSQTIHAGGRYLSSDEPTRTFAFQSKNTEPVKMEVLWPNHRISTIPDVEANHHYRIRYSEELSTAEQNKPEVKSPLFTDVSHLLNFKPQSSPPGMPASNITKSLVEPNPPNVSWFDINHDGWEDLWISSGLNQAPGIFINREGKSFERLPSQPQQRDALGAVATWEDGRGNRFWLVAASHRLSTPKRSSAVSFFNGTSTQPELHLETGPEGIGTLCVADVDLDGDQDLFIGSTSVYGRYPEPADSQIWINEHGKLIKNTKWSQVFESVGHVNAATYFDLDGDDRPDLALATEWGPIRIFQNSETGFIDQTDSLGLTDKTGQWTSIASGDFNQDGRIDLVAGNKGLNTSSSIHHSQRERIWFGDADGNHQIDSIESWFRDGNWIPSRSRTELSMVFPSLPQKITSHRQFSKTTIAGILADQFNKFEFLESRVAESSIFLNEKEGFRRVSLPLSAQESPVFSVIVADMNHDDALDIFMGQNKFPGRLDITRHDNGRGLCLRGNGKGQFREIRSPKSGIQIFGETRSSTIKDFDHDGKPDLAVTQKDGSVYLYKGN